ncbi:MAG: enolase C-terminal domain-like protein [Verrucomicrobiota bacterium]
MSDRYYWPYTLRSAGALNAKSQRREHQGFLIRIEDGVGCVHPWPELGDAPVESQLEAWRTGRQIPLLTSALACAKLDGEARRAGRSLLTGSDAPVQPRNHRLVLPEDDPDQCFEEGYRAGKWKIGREDPVQFSDRVRPWVERGFRLRLDANETFSVKEFLRWWDALDPSVRDAVDWVEDPVPISRWRAVRLRRAGVSVAVDRTVARHYRVADVAVYKPALDDSPFDAGLNTKLLGWAQSRRKQIVVTSYMDHPIGQLWASYAAASLAALDSDCVDLCGLLTQHCFETCAFSEQLDASETRLVPPAGTGLGFDELLDSLSWKRLG